jgi:hypothetical protein
MRNSLKTVFLTGLLCLSSSASAVPTDFDFSGTFTNDNDIVLLNFSIDSTSAVTIFSSSWIAGDSGLGFDPILSIWDSSGTLIQQQDDGHNIGQTLSNGVLYDHGTWDSYFSISLGGGNYTASIGQYDNFANGTSLADGFRYDGNPNFTFDNGYGTADLFNGVWSATDTRTGDWEFHILNVETATVVPIPATVWLFGSGLLGLISIARKKAA